MLKKRLPWISSGHHLLTIAFFSLFAGFIFLVDFCYAAKNESGNPSFSRMVLIPAGEFTMGTNSRHDDEGPEHTVFVKEFFIDLYEVTNADYKEFTDATNHKKPFNWKKGVLPQEKKDHPVVYVSWFDAHDYCEWKKKRLPTEQEWEKAARGTDGRVYPWGNDFNPERSNNPQKGSKGTEPVGSYENGKSPYGIYDLSGNVWEWIDAWYLPHPGNTKPKAEYGRNKRLLKGGSWFDCLTYGCGISAPAYNRSYFVPTVKNYSFGFRCAKEKK